MHPVNSCFIISEQTQMGCRFEAPATPLEPTKQFCAVIVTKWAHFSKRGLI
jgi:hypothetical protein